MHVYVCNVNDLCISLRTLYFIYLLYSAYGQWLCALPPRCWRDVTTTATLGMATTWRWREQYVSPSYKASTYIVNIFEQRMASMAAAWHLWQVIYHGDLFTLLLLRFASCCCRMLYLSSLARFLHCICCCCIYLIWWRSVMLVLLIVIVLMLLLLLYMIIEIIMTIINVAVMMMSISIFSFLWTYMDEYST